MSERKDVVQTIVDGIIDAALFIAFIGVVSMWFLLVLAIVLPVLTSGKAHAHDVYTGVRNQFGQLCCGGDPIKGDCEPLKDEDILVSDAYVVIRSHRYGITVRVAPELVTWLPIEGSDAPGHWCGVVRPRDRITTGVPEQIDMTAWTYCLFIAPGGV